MQDATAQMALLQFMQAGRPRVAVPSTVHCDHLIQAEVVRCRFGKCKNTEQGMYDFLASVSDKYGIGFWKPAPELFTRLFRKLCFPRGTDDALTRTP